MTPGMSEERARELVKNGFILKKETLLTDMEEHFTAKGYLAGLEQEREKIKEKDAEIETLRNEVQFLHGIIDSKEGQLESSRQEIERLKDMESFYKAELENQHDLLEAERQSTRELREALEICASDPSGMQNTVKRVKQAKDVLARHKAGGKAT